MIISAPVLSGGGNRAEISGGMKSSATSAPEIKVVQPLIPEPFFRIPGKAKRKIRKNNFRLHKKRFSYESVSKEDTNEVCKSGDKIPLHVSRGEV